MGADESRPAGVHPDEESWAPVIPAGDSGPEIRYGDDPLHKWAQRQRDADYDGPDAGELAEQA